MCGRYTLISAPEAIRILFGYGEQPNFPARYNIAPTQADSDRSLGGWQAPVRLMRWGLLPSWVKDPRAFSLIINARGEGVADKPAFRAAIRRRRCLIPADGFYEWKAGVPRKQPYFYSRQIRRAARFRRTLGDLDRAERRGAGHGGHRHHQCQWRAVGAA